jgi:hypothetical protein
MPPLRAERSLRVKAEHELKMARLEVTRLRRVVISLQRIVHVRDKVTP